MYWILIYFNANKQGPNFISSFTLLKSKEEMGGEWKETLTLLKSKQGIDGYRRENN